MEKKNTEKKSEYTTYGGDVLAEPRNVRKTDIKDTHTAELFWEWNTDTRKHGKCGHRLGGGVKRPHSYGKAELEKLHQESKDN